MVHHSRHRGFTRVPVPGQARRHAARLQALRHRVGAPARAGGGTEHGRRLQPAHRHAGARGQRARGDRRHRPHAGALWQPRRGGPVRAAVGRHPERRVQAAGHHGAAVSGHLPGRGRLLAERGVQAPDRHAARPGGHPQGLWLQHAAGGAALRADRHADLRARHRAGRGPGRLAGHPLGGAVPGQLPLSVPALFHRPAGGGPGRRREPAGGAGWHRLCGVCRRGRAGGAGHAPARAGALQAHAGGAPGPDALAVAAYAHHLAPAGAPARQGVDVHHRAGAGRRHHADVQLSDRLDQLHGRAHLPARPAARPVGHLHRSQLAPGRARVARAAGRAACRRHPHGGGAPAP